MDVGSVQGEPEHQLISECCSSQGDIWGKMPQTKKRLPANEMLWLERTQKAASI